MLKKISLLFIVGLIIAGVGIQPEKRYKDV